MDFAHTTALIAMAIGAALIALGIATRQRGGRALLWLGGAFIVGPLSPLLRGRLSESAQITCSVAAIGFAVAAMVDATRLRRRSAR
jgi:hypothetical protein